MNRNRRIEFFAMLVVLILEGCTGTRHLAEGEFLARDGEVKIEQKEAIKGFSDISYQAKRLATVKQNNKLFWMRPRLSIYNAFKEPKKEKGFKHWLKYKLGAPPVLYSDTKTERIRQAIEGHLFNQSYLNARVEYKLKEDRHQKQAIFYVYTGPSFAIGEKSYLPSGTVHDSTIKHQLNTESLLVTKQPYKFDQLLEERNRIAFSLMNSGYYYFRPDYFEFQADTFTQPQQINLALGMKPTTPAEAYNKFKIHTVTVKDFFRLDTGYVGNKERIGNIDYLTPYPHINPEVVINTIHLHPDSLYNRNVHLKTLNQIRSLQVYKFVNITYTQDDSLSDRLNANILLEPLSNMSFSGELNANIKSNNFAGPGLQLAFTKRNAFKNAELFQLSTSGRFETQIGQGFVGNTSYEARVDAGLQFPRLFPFKLHRVKGMNLPSTSINLGWGLQERVQWYKMLNWNTTLRYSWRHSEKVSHRVSPMDINLSKLLETTEQFQDYLDSNPSVRRSFEEQFILGTNYDFYYSASADRLNTPFFMGITLDFSGLLLGAVTQLVEQQPASTTDPYEVFTLPYAQYLRTVWDFRRTIRLWPKHSLAFRVNAGAGLPYGNSVVMPYIKQFYVGGTNSLRGFQARSVGPGTFQTETDSDGFIDQAGDLKLELNAEYRFPLWGVLHSAMFIDAGNIWLVNEDEARPGSQFQSSDFLNELAVSSGLGLRIKFDPLVIRFDWAWPLRFPYEVNGSNWVVKDIGFDNPNWRKENLILNISLGYPF